MTGRPGRVGVVKDLQRQRPPADSGRTTGSLHSPSPCSSARARAAAPAWTAVLRDPPRTAPVPHTEKHHPLRARRPRRNKAGHRPRPRRRGNRRSVHREADCTRALRHRKGFQGLVLRPQPVRRWTQPPLRLAPRRHRREAHLRAHGRDDLASLRHIGAKSGLRRCCWPVWAR